MSCYTVDIDVTQAEIHVIYIAMGDYFMYDIVVEFLRDMEGIW